MTTFVLVHGAWHGPWGWRRVVPYLHAAGARVLTPDIGAGGGLHDHAAIVASVLGALPYGERAVLAGHSYAGLVVREAADARPGAVGHLVLVDGWAGGDGAALLDLAPEAFGAAMRSMAGDGPWIPAPAPAAFGVTDAAGTAWLAERLVPQPLRAFTEPTRLTGAVDAIPGTAVHCEPATYPFERLGAALGYRTEPLHAPHDAPLTHPEPLARLLLAAAPVQEREARSLQ